MAPLAGNGSMRKDISHPGAAMRSRVPDHEHFAFPVLFIDDPAARLRRRTDSFQARHPDSLNGACRHETARKPVVPAGGGERLINGADHALVLVPQHSTELLDDGWPRHTTFVEKRSCLERSAAKVVTYIFGEITAAFVQIPANRGKVSKIPWRIGVAMLPVRTRSGQVRCDLGVHLSFASSRLPTVPGVSRERTHTAAGVSALISGERMAK
jgi:hypothetical protein